MANQYERAYRAWPMLTKCADNGKTLTYGQLAKRLGIHHRTVRFLLGKIQDYCLEEKLPPLTILVVNQSTQRPSEGFIAWDADNLPEGRENVFKYSWDALPNPFQFAADGSRYEQLVSELRDSPENSKDVYTKVKVRGIAQQIFRSSLLNIYRGRCAFTIASFPRCLDAAHIISWSKSTPEQRMDVRNGILMTSFHHRLFDQGILTIDEKFRIRYYDPEMKYGQYSKYDKLLTVDLHGKKMWLPRNQKHSPKVEWVLERNRTLDWDIS